MLEAQGVPTSITALTQATGWHANTVRGHLIALWQDGYLTREREQHPEGRGRPSWLWQAKQRDTDSSYARLAGALAASLAITSPHPAADAREAGRNWGRALGAGLSVAPTEPEARNAVVDIMRNEGFAPKAEASPVIRLLRCPLLEAAVRHRDIVCAVHLGMISGVLEAVGHADSGSELEPFSAPGECRLTLRVAS